jgi:hypothetical protein
MIDAIQERDYVEGVNLICPGCGWVGLLHETNEGACPDCGYENGSNPYRLLTLQEMRRCEGADWNDVDMSAFLGAVLAEIDLQRREDGE